MGFVSIQVEREQRALDSPGYKTMAKKNAYCAETVVSAPPGQEDVRCGSIEVRLSVPPYRDAATNLISSRSDSVNSSCCSMLVETKEGGALPAACKVWIKRL